MRHDAVSPRPLIGGLTVLLALASVSGPAGSQAGDPDGLGRQADQRIAELQAEADRLAADAVSMLAALRRLEVEREIRREERARAEAALAEITALVAAAEARVSALRNQRIAESPAVGETLAAIYKRGRGGYARMLLASTDLRTLGRLARGVTAVAQMDRARLEAYRRTLAAEQEALASLERRRVEHETAQADAAAARQALERAVAAHNRRLDELDRRRDLAAQYIGELQEAQARLQQTVKAIGSAEAAALPIAPFRGALEWPVPGRILTRFGRGGSQPGSTIERSGIEIGAAEGSPVRAVHGGTIAYAAPFTGYGGLVIVDHGEGVLTLYGHLSRMAVASGARVARGDLVGHSGRTPAGTPAAYFELRIDGRPVDPVQWFRSLR